MKALIIISAVFSLVGCASTAVPLSEAITPPIDRVYAYQVAKPEYATLTIVRDNSFSGGGCFATIYINGNRAATLDSKEKATFHLPMGEWMIGAQIQGRGLCGYSGERQEREIILTSGSEKFVRIFTDGDGNLDIRPTTIK